MNLDNSDNLAIITASFRVKKEKWEIKKRLIERLISSLRPFSLSSWQP
jgi:hypothetical protein